MTREPIQVVGLRDLTRSLRAVDTGLPKMVRLALNEASDTVVDRAIPSIPARTGRARRSVKASSTRNAARVKAGGNRAPYFPWLDFGGRTGRKGEDGKGTTVRRFYTDGRYLWPAYYEARDSGEFGRILDEALGRLIRQAGLDG